MRYLTLRGGPCDGRVVLNPLGNCIVAPTIEAYVDGTVITCHEYDIVSGEYIGVQLRSEPNKGWAVELFPRWAKFRAKLRRLRTLRLRFDDDEGCFW